MNINENACGDDAIIAQHIAYLNAPFSAEAVAEHEMMERMEECNDDCFEQAENAYRHQQREDARRTGFWYGLN